MELTSIYEVRSLDASGLKISTRIAFNKDHIVFEGHFPGNPIVPGVVQIQIMKDLLEHIIDKKVFLQGAKSIKFLNVISPAEVEEVQFEILLDQQSQSNFTVQCVVKTPNKVYMKYTGEAIISATK